MDQNQNNKTPLLYFILNHIDPNTHPPLTTQQEQNLLTQFPQLTNPRVLTSLTQATDTKAITQTQTVLSSLGPRPDPDAVSRARSMIAQMEETGEGGGGVEVEMYKAVVRMESMHEEYERQVREVEERLVGVYRDVAGGCEVNEDVVKVLRDAESGLVVERLDLSGRELRFLPEAFGRLHGLLVLNLAHNQLEILPDAIAGLQKLKELNVSGNLLVSLPDSIGLLRNLKVLNVSGNKLNSLPESISLCSALLELDASFNNLMSLPTNVGYGLTKLEKLSIQLNKIRFLPSSICKMVSLKYLDVHFNELHGLPLAIGKLTNLECLNVGSNFSDLTELPGTIGDLTNLRELDISNNQIHALPETFYRLENLTKLNLEGNPLVVPPKEVVDNGVEAIRELMTKRWMDKIEQERSGVEATHDQAQSGWLVWGTSALSNVVHGVGQTISGYLGGPKAPADPYLDQQL